MDSEDGGGSGTLSRGASNLAQRVGSFFGGGSSSGGSGSGKRGRRGKSGERDGKHRRSASGGETASRVEVGYHGRRTDARDRSSEDPKRHHIPRASVTPTKSRSPAPSFEETTTTEEAGAAAGRPRVKLRRKSLEREMERRASRERELEREKRLRERSRSRERLAELSSSGQVRPETGARQKQPQQQQQQPTSTTSTTRVIPVQVSTSSYQRLQQQQLSLVRSSSSVTSSRRPDPEGSPTRRQASFRVERNLQLSRSDLGISPPVPPVPPVPPPRTKAAAHKSPQPPAPAPPVTETSFDDDVSPVSTSTPKKTPYQFWREQRLLREDSPSSSSLMHSSSTSTVINTLQSETVQKQQPQQQQQQHKEQSADSTTTTITSSSKEEQVTSSSTGAVRKQFAVDSATAEASSTGINVAMHAATTTPERPPEKAEDILARWKRERAKRERHPSGTSAASSSTAEPARKKFPYQHHQPLYHHIPVVQQSSTIETTTSTSRKERKTSSLASMLQALTKRKGSSKEHKEEEEHKYATISALVKSAPLDPHFHEAVIHPSEEEGGRGGGPGRRRPLSTVEHISPAYDEADREPVLGTVLHPVPPRPRSQQGSGARTPFEEWRHYRSNRERQEISAPLVHSYSPLPPSPGMVALRAKTPDPDYDTASVASTSSRSSYGGGGHRAGGGSSHEDLRRQVGPQYYSHSPRSTSSLGIPRYVHLHPQQQQQHHQQQPPRPPSSMVSASPRLEHHHHPAESSFFGRHGARLASAESHVWYQEYSHEAFPHDAIFEREQAVFGVHNFDVRINSIRGRKDGRQGCQLPRSKDWADFFSQIWKIENSITVG